jgi:hypothetical protein
MTSRVQLTDDLGTGFRWSAGNAGGSGTEMLCEWSFEPAMPVAVSALTVTITSTDGTESSCTVGS